MCSFTICMCTIALATDSALQISLALSLHISLLSSALPTDSSCLSLPVFWSLFSTQKDHCSLLRFPLPCTAVQKVLPGRKGDHLFPFSEIFLLCHLSNICKQLFYIVFLVFSLFMARGQIQYQLICGQEWMSPTSINFVILFLVLMGHKWVEKITYRDT